MIETGDSGRSDSGWFRIWSGRLWILGMASVALVSLFGCQANGLNEKTAAEFVGRWTKAYNSHDLPAFVALYAPKGVFSVPPMLGWVKTREELRGRMDSRWREMPDARIENTGRLVVGRDRIAFTWRLVFTDAKTKKPAAFLGASFVTFGGGLITDHAIIFRQ